MAHQHRAREIQAMDRGFLAQAVDRGTNILEGPGIATPGLVGAPVPDAPDRDATARQFRPEMAKLLPPCALDIFPATAVDKDGDGMRAGTRGQEDVDRLGGCLAVADLHCGLRPG
jgi:hypothetical protein